MSIIRLIVTFLGCFICLHVWSKELVISNVNLINVDSMKIEPARTIVIEEGKITQVINGKYESKDEHVIHVDMTGKYAMPGLIDAHVHHATDPDGSDNPKVVKQRLQHLLRGGVTSVRDMGGDARTLANLKRLASIDQIQSPDIYFSIIIGGKSFFADPRTVSSAKGQNPGDAVWMRAVDIHSDFNAIALQAKGIGASGIKVYADVSAGVLSPLYTAAKKHGLKVWSHASISPATPLDSVTAGADVLSHIPDLAGQAIDDYRDWRVGKFELSEAKFEHSLQSKVYDELLSSMKQNNVIIDATMSVFEQSKKQSPRRAKIYKQAQFLLRLAIQNQLKIAAGTDGFADLGTDLLPPIHKELELLVTEGGLSPLQALQSATKINAEALGIEQTHGSISEGMTANILVLDQDPTLAIENTQHIAHVIKNGHFIYRGNMPNLPFVSAREANGMLWMSGQLGNLPTTMTLAGDTIEAQMHQTLTNIGDVLQEHNLDYDDVVKCTLMLADIKEWRKVNDVYKQFFSTSLPTRSAFAASGLALNAKVEVECIAAH